jgi:hypothetical protein
MRGNDAAIKAEVPFVGHFQSQATVHFGNGIHNLKGLRLAARSINTKGIGGEARSRHAESRQDGDQGEFHVVVS